MADAKIARMSRPNRSFLHTLMQRVGASRPGAWFASRALHSLDHLAFKATGGRATLGNLFGGVPVALVTTTGARSGLKRTLPLLYIRDRRGSEAMALIASNWGQQKHPAWYFNLKANPRVLCSISGNVREYVAHEARGQEYDRFWEYATETYLGYPVYRERAGKRHIPIMVLEPETQSRHAVPRQ